MTFRLTLAGGICAVLIGCGPAADQESDGDLISRANVLAQDSIIVDTHIDVPYRLDKKWEDVIGATQDGNFDYPRAVAGGLNAPFMSIYTPASLEAEGGSKAKAEELIDIVNRIVESAPDKFAIALSPADIEEQFSKGLISLPMGMENGSPIESDLANLQYFFDRGIRYITLAHSLSNLISDSSYDKNRQWDGLSEFGESVVTEMNRLGMMIDISHVSDAAFHDVIEITSAPVIASHSSARYFTPGFERNMSDDMIRALAQNGGVIMVNYGSSFVTGKARSHVTARDAAYKDHIDFHVGIGSDYDGVGDSLPVGLKDVSSYPNLVHGLLMRGYSDEDIEKILGLNLLRVWRKVEAAAEQ